MNKSFYTLFLWPSSQEVMHFEGAVFVEAATEDDAPLSSAYVVPRDVARRVADKMMSRHRRPPETGGDFILVSWPDAAAHLQDKGVVTDAEGNAYVPVDL